MNKPLFVASFIASPSSCLPPILPKTPLPPRIPTSHPSPPPSAPIEPLEPRIAPAVTILSAHSAFFTDVDGDHVTLQVSKGDLHTATFTTAAVGLGDQLELVDLTTGSFEGANLTITVDHKASTGDGLVNVGAINATGQDLGKVTIGGDLGQIDLGSNSTTVPALKKLNVQSLGIYGLATQGGTGNLFSDISGTLGELKVSTDIHGASVQVSGANQKIGSVFIGGSLIGTDTPDSGLISSSGAIDNVRIRGDILGGTGANTGFLQASGRLGNVSVGGSLIGGPGSISGQIGGSSIGSIQIGHDIVGGVGAISGSIGTAGKIGSVAVGGSVVGGTGDISGSIGGSGNIGSIFIGGNLQGGGGGDSGHIQANANVGNIRIGGSLLGGSGFVSGQIQLNGDINSLVISGDVKGDTAGVSGQIQANGKLGRLEIGGSVLGNNGDSSGELQINGSTGTVKIGHDLRGGSANNSGKIAGTGSIDKLSIGGSLIGGGGSFTGGVFINDIGTLAVGGNLQGSSISGSGSVDSTGEIVGRHIGSAFIGGSIISGIDNSTGTLTNNAGIRASQDIGSLVVGGNLVGNTTTSGNSPVIISAQGQANPTSTKNIAIGSMVVAGQVENTLVLGGYTTAVDAADTRTAFANANAQIGPVAVGGDWIASSLVAGAIDNLNNGFGNADDTSGGTIAKIAKVIIGGNVAGTAASGDHFGFESSQIGAFRYSGFSAPLSAGTQDIIELSPITGDVTIREVV